MKKVSVIIPCFNHSEYLLDAVKSVVNSTYKNLEIIVGNLNDIKFKEKFDYITLIGVLEYQGQYTNTENSYVDFLNTVKKLLKPNGKLLIAIENKYGLKYWCGAREDHTGIPFDSINQYGIGNKNAKTFSKQELSQLIKNSGFQNLFFYYPMPDYKLPTVIYSEKKLPDNENMQNLQPYYLDNSTLVANEKNIYKDLIENQVFEFFANSFLVECSDGDVGKITFANISSERLAQYRIVTRFCNNEKVEKYALEDNIGREHLVQTWKNQEALKKIGMKVWNLQLKDKVLISDYSKEQLLENKLLDSFKKKNIAEICEILDKAYYDILHSSSHIEENKNIMFELGIADEKNTKSYGPILSIGFLDMIFRNAFYKQGDLYWFDQEWILESIPAKYILYTAIVEFYQSFPQCEQVLSIKEIAQKYEIESLLLGLMLELVKQDELINDYYTPFIKSKLDNKQADYEKEIKNLDKQMDRIKTAYIKGVLKLNDFDKEIKHIEYQRTELTNKLNEHNRKRQETEKKQGPKDQLALSEYSLKQENGNIQ